MGRARRRPASRREPRRRETAPSLTTSPQACLMPGPEDQERGRSTDDAIAQEQVAGGGQGRPLLGGVTGLGRVDGRVPGRKQVEEIEEWMEPLARVHVQRRARARGRQPATRAARWPCWRRPATPERPRRATKRSSYPGKRGGDRLEMLLDRQLLRAKLLAGAAFGADAGSLVGRDPAVVGLDARDPA